MRYGMLKKDARFRSPYSAEFMNKERERANNALYQELTQELIEEFNFAKELAKFLIELLKSISKYKKEKKDKEYQIALTKLEVMMSDLDDHFYAYDNIEFFDRRLKLRQLIKDNFGIHLENHDK